MRIANYLRPDCVALRQRADSLTGAVQQMVTLLDGTDNLTDTAVFAADVRARLALGGVCVGSFFFPWENFVQSYPPAFPFYFP